MSTIIVKSKNELKKAVKQQYDTIIVEGELAKKLQKAYKFKSKFKLIEKILGKDKKAINTKTIAAGSLAGIDIVAILIVVFLGLGFLIWLTDGYDLEVELAPHKVALKKKKSDGASIATSI